MTSKHRSTVEGPAEVKAARACGSEAGRWTAEGAAVVVVVVDAVAATVLILLARAATRQWLGRELALKDCAPAAGAAQRTCISFFGRGRAKER
jgi:hypothetical protein